MKLVASLLLFMTAILMSNSAHAIKCFTGVGGDMVQVPCDSGGGDIIPTKGGGGVPGGGSKGGGGTSAPSFKIDPITSYHKCMAQTYSPLPIQNLNFLDANFYNWTDAGGSEARTATNSAPPGYSNWDYAVTDTVTNQTIFYRAAYDQKYNSFKYINPDDKKTYTYQIDPGVPLPAKQWMLIVMGHEIAHQNKIALHDDTDENDRMEADGWGVKMLQKYMLAPHDGCSEP